MVHVHGGSGAGATMAPEGKDNIKGEACWGCKRNSLLVEQHELWSTGKRYFDMTEYFEWQASQTPLTSTALREAS